MNREKSPMQRPAGRSALATLLTMAFPPVGVISAGLLAGFAPGVTLDYGAVFCRSLALWIIANTLLLKFGDFEGVTGDTPVAATKALVSLLMVGIVFGWSVFLNAALRPPAIDYRVTIVTPLQKFERSDSYAIAVDSWRKPGTLERLDIPAALGAAFHDRVSVCGTAVLKVARGLLRVPVLVGIDDFRPAACAPKAVKPGPRISQETMRTVSVINDNIFYLSFPIGLFFIAAALRNWDWFFMHSRFPGANERSGARLLYLVVGIVMLAVGIWHLL